MSKIYNEQFFSSLEYILKFRDTLSEKELLNNIENKYQLTKEEAREILNENYE